MKRLLLIYALIYATAGMAAAHPTDAETKRSAAELYRPESIDSILDRQIDINDFLNQLVTYMNIGYLPSQDYLTLLTTLLRNEEEYEENIADLLKAQDDLREKQKASLGRDRLDRDRVEKELKAAQKKWRDKASTTLLKLYATLYEQAAHRKLLRSSGAVPKTPDKAENYLNK